MYPKLKNLLGLAALVAAAVASWYWSRDAAQPRASAAQTDAGSLGYYLRDTQIAVIDTDGRVLYEISAASLEERPDEGRALMQHVAVRYSPAVDVPWEVRAEAGELLDDERYIDLSGGVELRSMPGSGRGPTIIESANFRLLPDDYVASTDDPVSVYLGDERLDAVGMNVDLKGDHLQLESNVHGQFTP